MEQGLEQGREEVAREMLRKGMSAELVEECTNLRRETVLVLQRELSDTAESC